MQILRSLLPLPKKYPTPSLDLTLSSRRLVLRVGDPADWHHWRMLRELSRDFLTPWEPSWPPNAMTYSYYCGLLRRQWREWRHGQGYSFFIYCKNKSGGEPALIGGIALSNIERGIAQRGTVGYWLGSPFIGHGYMAEALTLVSTFAFQSLKLHRIEASCLPHNVPSKNLLERQGFDQEGYAKSYLQINGLWQDHLLWGKRAP